MNLDLQILHFLSSESESSDSDSDYYILDESDDEEEQTTITKTRVNFMSILDDAEFKIRFRLDKPAVQELLNEIHPHLRVTGSRLVFMIFYLFILLAFSIDSYLLYLLFYKSNTMIKHFSFDRK